MSPLSCDNGWTDRNADCHVNTVDKTVTRATNLVNFGPVTPRSCVSFPWAVTAHRLKFAVRWF